MKRFWTSVAILGGALIVASTAGADTAVVGVSPRVATPGEQVDVRIACGACPADETFPVSLVPVGKAPKPRRCRGNQDCSVTAAEPPRKRPFLFLGETTRPRARAPEVRPPGSDSHLRFTVPAIEPGAYAFVIFAMSRRGGPGTLITSTAPGDVLRVLPKEPAMDSAEDDSDAALWIAGIATATLGLVVLLFGRSRQTGR